ncbi:BlaI/MecI/CopY family transcriptional regulator [Acetivibrio straminisolvens]|jgi:BlaI family penicillinase repressor|uniref:Beta-lactamase repressor BlaI n=1 Tax=Acetivibrio straminisolvens JCM 21531 TaxID=1294263 RepID=W4VC92_9FIRM|nr:BlaI/MecI/CopY family transcriptional regulator [Acetivibrio straminisolvens]GAE90816.1 beta-lactamase repressor BlaI [Acetivibrio straminisolvens JCM 21531]
MKKPALSDGEWKLMNLLWEKSPRTIAEMVAALKNDTAWTKATINIMLGRMINKGAVRCDDSRRSKLFYPIIDKEEAAVHETENFLSKVYNGSLSMMIASLAGQKALRAEDIEELYKILNEAEKEVEK